MASLHWTREKKFGVTETDVITGFRLNLNRSIIDVSTLEGGPTKFIAGQASGTIELDIYNSTVDWGAAMVDAEETVFVLPDQNDTTVVGVVTGANYTHQYNQHLNTTVVTMHVTKLIT